MKNEIDFEAIENATGKISTGFRCQPELKLQLVNEATELGVFLSEHLENIVSNRNTFDIERTELKAEIERHRNEKEALSQEVSKLRNESDNRMKELERLKIKVNDSATILGFLSHPFLLSLFEKLKGLKDTIDGSDGKKYSFEYNSPSDLLLAMIYSFQIKKQ